MKATRESFGEKIQELGNENKNIVVLTADLALPTKVSNFKKEFPERFFEIGISEQDMLSTAAGMATCGKIPFVAGFAVFTAGRAYEQIRNSVCYPNLNVKICGTHAGVTVGKDGATHQMLEDFSLMRTLPNMKVMCTSDDIQTKWAIEEIAKIKGPVYLRLGRIATPEIYNVNQKFEIGKGVQIGNGTDGTVIATGVVVNEAIKAKEELEKYGINIRIIDMHTIKPIDKEIIIKSAKETKKIVTIEDHSIIGGLGSSVCEVLAENYPTHVTRMGIEDKFGKSGSGAELLKYFGLSFEKIIEQFYHK